MSERLGFDKSRQKTQPFLMKSKFTFRKDYWHNTWRCAMSFGVTSSSAYLDTSTSMRDAHSTRNLGDEGLLGKPNDQTDCSFGRYEWTRLTETYVLYKLIMKSRTYSFRLQKRWHCRQRQRYENQNPQSIGLKIPTLFPRKLPYFRK